jgi:hypothetical protein
MKHPVGLVGELQGSARILDGCHSESNRQLQVALDFRQRAERNADVVSE